MLRRNVLIGLSALAATTATARDVAAIKADILRIAENTAAMTGDGQAVPRAQLESLMHELLAVSPQKPLRQRLPQLIGIWTTLLAPTDRPDQGRANPRIDTAHVIQVVSDKGYYYNIIPFIDSVHPEKSKLGLLRGEYGFSAVDPSVLAIHYTRFYGCQGHLDDPAPWRFAALEEAGRLPDRVNVVPDLVLHLFLPDTTVLEVWSDGDTRLAYGTKDAASGKRSLYVMRKLAV